MSDRMTRVATEGPTFVGIGMMKAGTTLVHALLDHHEAAAVPLYNKEVSFFDVHRRRGLDWYATHFDLSEQPTAWGDLTPGYVLSDAAMLAIAELPSCPKVIVCLRDPVDRIRSQYLHDRATLGTRLSFADYLTADYNRAVTRSRYARLLAPWLDAIGHERLHLFVLEDYQAEPVDTAGLLFDRLCVRRLDRGELDAIGRVNEAISARSPIVAGAAHRAQRALRSVGLYPLASKLAGTGALRRLVFTDTPPSRPSEPVPPDLADELRQDVEALAMLTRRAFPRWSVT